MSIFSGVVFLMLHSEMWTHWNLLHSAIRHTQLGGSDAHYRISVGYLSICGGNRWRSWFRHCVTSHKFAGSIPYGGSTQPLNRLTPNDPYMGRTAPLTSKRFILYIYSTIIGTEYFKNALYSPSFSLQNAVCFIMLTCLVPVLFTFYIPGVLKLKK